LAVNFKRRGNIAAAGSRWLQCRHAVLVSHVKRWQKSWVVSNQPDLRLAQGLKQIQAFFFYALVFQTLHNDTSSLCHFYLR